MCCFGRSLSAAVRCLQVAMLRGSLSRSAGASSLAAKPFPSLRRLRSVSLPLREKGDWPRFEATHCAALPQKDWFDFCLSQCLPPLSPR